MMKRILVGAMALALIGGALGVGEIAVAAPAHGPRTHMVCHTVTHRTRLHGHTIVRHDRVCHRERY